MSQKGTSHFVMQRASAIFMIPLVIWFIVNVIRHSSDSHAEFTAWIAKHPWTAALPLAALILLGFFHMRIGVAEAIDDYIHKPGLRSMLQFLNTLFALVLGALALWSIIAIAFIV